MATAGNHKIIIEKGADFVIDVQVSENGIVHKNLTGFTVSMVIKYVDPITKVITIQDTIPGVLVPDNPLLPVLDWTYFNGYLKVIIDKAATALYPTRLPAEYDPFATSYEYYYSINIIGPNSQDYRVLRGKCAVREG